MTAKYKDKRIAKVDKRPKTGNFRVQWGRERKYTEGVWKGKTDFTLLGSRTFNKKKDAIDFAKRKRNL